MKVIFDIFREKLNIYLNGFDNCFSHEIISKIKQKNI